MTDPLIPARDPLGRGMPADLVETFAPLGAILRLETNSSDVLEACRESFGGFGAPPAEEPAAFSLRLLVDSTFRAAPPWPEPVFRGTGDIVFGEFDGILIIPRADAVTVLEKAEEIVGAEGLVRAEVRGGDSPWSSFERHGHI